MKRLISFFLTLIFVMSGFSSVHASQMQLSDELTAKLSSVKERIEDTSEYEKFNANKRSYNDKTTYNFEWYTDNETLSKSLNITVNSEDVITNYYKYIEKENIDNKPSINKLSSKEVSDKTKALIYQLNPMLVDKIAIENPKYDSLYNQEYEFSVQRIEDGIPVYGDSGYVTVSSDGAYISNFYMNYTCGLKFPSGLDYISADEAKTAYENQLGLKLIYDIKYGEKRQRTAVLKYVRSEDSNTYISASDGSIYVHTMENGAAGGGASSKNMAMATESARDDASFSFAELNELEKLDGLIDVNLLEKNLRENIYLNIDESFALQNSSVSRDYYDEEKYTYRLGFESEDKEKSCYITCDAVSGNVISYSRYVPYLNDKNDKYTATGYAKEAVEELADEYLTDDIDNTYRIVDEQSGYVKYVRFVNGVEVPYDVITIKINDNDGKIDSYNLNYNNLEFPAPDFIVGLQSATQEVFENVDYSIVYLPQMSGNCAIPVYRFVNVSPQVDAITGKIISNTEAVELSDYSDIDGHYAQEQINALKQYGIGFAGGEFMPDNEITQGEYLALLSAVFSNWSSPIVLKEGYDFSNVYTFAERYNLLEQSDAEQTSVLTRSAACVLLVKAMGYDEVACLSDIFVTEFEDVFEEKGYIAILDAMDIIEGNGTNKFYPQKTLTRAEAAVILYNYLSR